MKSLSLKIAHMEKRRHELFDRLEKIVQCLGETKKDYAIIGGNAIIAWMRAKDMDSRNTLDVDVMIRKEDLEELRANLDSKGYEYIKSGGMHLFFDTSEKVPRKIENCIRFVFSGQTIKESSLPELEWKEIGGMNVATIENLVQMKVNASRPKDIEHLQDLINAGYTTPQKIHAMADKFKISEEKRILLSYLESKRREKKI